MPIKQKIKGKNKKATNIKTGEYAWNAKIESDK